MLIVGLDTADKHRLLDQPHLSEIEFLVMDVLLRHAEREEF